MFCKKLKKKMAVLGLSACVALTMTACQGVSASAGGTAEAATKSTAATTTEMFTERDLSGDYDESSAVQITLQEDQTTCEASGVTIDGQTITITAEGVYVLTGTLSDGQIMVDAGDQDKVQLVLKGATITNDSTAAIYVKQADKVFLTLAEGTDNTLSVTGAYEAIDDSNIDSVVYSKDDVTVNGSGALTVTAKYGHGIVSKDDLKLTGGSVTVTAEKKALSGNDSVRIADGEYDLTSGTDAIHAEDSEKSAGFFYISGGTVTIDAGDDAIHAYTNLTVDGGTIKVNKSEEGLEGNTIIINDGEVDVTASDDGLNAASDTSTGESTGTAAASDSASASGTAAGDEAASGDTAKSGGAGKFGNDESCLIQINGGLIHVNAEGDGIDSNGSIEITGGETYVEGPTGNGNGSIDTGEGGKATITGGYFIATGSSGMTVNFSEDSTQGAILVNINGTTGKAELKDSSGKTLISLDSSKQYSCIQVSTPEIKQGETYTISAGGSEQSVTMDSLIYGSAGGMGGFGGHRGGFGGQAPDAGQNGDSSGNAGPGGSGHGGKPGSFDSNQSGDGNPGGTLPDGKNFKHPKGKKPDGNSSGDTQGNSSDGNTQKENPNSSSGTTTEV